jgi:peptidyl-tRNA hydrolase, PTH2 family
MKENNMKQIIVMRKDLNMRTGKMIAQGAHASMKATLENLDHPNVKKWLAGSFTKIAVSVGSEEELFEIMNKAKEAGLITALITDAGRTEFNHVPTNTCIAIGPATSDSLHPITGHLKLL